MLKADLHLPRPESIWHQRGHTRVRKWLLRTAIAAVAMAVAVAGAGKFYLMR